MEHPGSSHKIGWLSLPIAAAYFAAAAVAAPVMERTVIPIILEAVAPATAPLYGLGNGAWAGHILRALVFAVLALSTFLALLPLVAARLPRMATVCLGAIASLSVSAAWFLLANMSLWLSCSALVAAVAWGVSLRGFRPNNSSKPTPLRGAA